MRMRTGRRSTVVPRQAGNDLAVPTGTRTAASRDQLFKLHDRGIFGFALLSKLFELTNREPIDIVARQQRIGVRELRDDL